tara:strand:- start:112 stop:333 length:222 start_codon:yes stop_codon:yes gene_type:complete
MLFILKTLEERSRLNNQDTVLGTKYKLKEVFIEHLIWGIHSHQDVGIQVECVDAMNLQDVYLEFHLDKVLLMH